MIFVVNPTHKKAFIDISNLQSPAFRFFYQNEQNVVNYVINKLSVIDFDSESFKKYSGYVPDDLNIFKKDLTITHLDQKSMKSFKGKLEFTIYPNCFNLINVRVSSGDLNIPH